MPSATDNGCSLNPGSMSGSSAPVGVVIVEDQTIFRELLAEVLSAEGGYTILGQFSEGLAANGPHPLQQAWIAEEVPQCGYCQSGQIMAAAALLAKTPKPTEQQITGLMSGNLCRCGTYERIRKAIVRASNAGGAR